MCDVCRKKYRNEFKAQIHAKKGDPIELSLCYAHDIELFKLGQITFMKKYQYELNHVSLNVPLSTSLSMQDLDIKFT